MPRSVKVALLVLVLTAPFVAASEAWSASYDGRANGVVCVFGVNDSPCVAVQDGVNTSRTIRELGYAGAAPARLDGAATWPTGPVALDVFLVAEDHGAFVGLVQRHGMSPLPLAWSVPAGADDVRITVHAGVGQFVGAAGALVEPPRDFHVDVAAS